MQFQHKTRKKQEAATKNEKKSLRATVKAGHWHDNGPSWWVVGLQLQKKAFYCLVTQWQQMCLLSFYYLSSLSRQCAWWDNRDFARAPRINFQFRVSWKCDMPPREEHYKTSTFGRLVWRNLKNLLPEVGQSLQNWEILVITAPCRHDFEGRLFRKHLKPFIVFLCTRYFDRHPVFLTVVLFFLDYKRLFAKLAKLLFTIFLQVLHVATHFSYSEHTLNVCFSLKGNS